MVGDFEAIRLSGLQLLGAIGVILWGMMPNAPASAQSTSLPCGSAQHKAFDFFAGEWQVYDQHSGQLIAMDRIERQLESCSLQQTWTQMDDGFRPQGVPYRMRGSSLSGYDGKEWVMVWIDNMGSVVTLRGGIVDGVMVMVSDTPSLGTYYKWEWIPQADGSVRNVGYFADKKGDPWKEEFDILYKPNRPTD